MISLLNANERNKTQIRWNKYEKKIQTWIFARVCLRMHEIDVHTTQMKQSNLEINTTNWCTNRWTSVYQFNASERMRERKRKREIVLNKIQMRCAHVKWIGMFLMWLSLYYFHFLEYESSFERAHTPPKAMCPFDLFTDSNRIHFSFILTTYFLSKFCWLSTLAF